MTMANEKLIMLQMAVTDMAKAKAFYADQLGWTVTSDVGRGDKHWVSLSLPGGGATLTLTTMHAHMKPGVLQLYYSTSDIEEEFNQLKARGVELDEVKDDLYGPRSNVKFFELRDPDGNHWIAVQG